MWENEIRRLEEPLTTLKKDRAELLAKRDTAKKDAFDAALAVDEHRRVIRKPGAAGRSQSRSYESRTRSGTPPRSWRRIPGELTEIAEERARLHEESTGIEERRTGFKTAEAEAQQGLNELQAQLHAAAERRTGRSRQSRVDLATSKSGTAKPYQPLPTCSDKKKIYCANTTNARTTGLAAATPRRPARNRHHQHRRTRRC